MYSNFNSKKIPQGSWALVTGSTAGIGRAFSEQLAELGLNLVLLSRSSKDLESQRIALIDQWKIQARCITCDLADANLLRKVDEATHDVDIGVLINNAGAPSYHGRLFDRDERLQDEALRVNTIVQVQLLRHFGRLMATRGWGSIIQVSSITGHIVMPFMAEYSASKAFQLAFGEALFYEFKDYGIDFLVVSPGATKSRRVSFGMEAEDVVTEALQALGRQPSILPGWRNKWTAFMNRHLRSRHRAIAAMGEFQRKNLRPAPIEKSD